MNLFLNDKSLSATTTKSFLRPLPQCLFAVKNSIRFTITSWPKNKAANSYWWTFWHLFITEISLSFWTYDFFKHLPFILFLLYVVFTDLFRIIMTSFCQNCYVIKDDPDMPQTQARMGRIVPNFTANSLDGKIDFHEWLGDSWGFLFSHPAHFASVCTTEMSALAKANKVHRCSCLLPQKNKYALNHRWAL